MIPSEGFLLSVIGSRFRRGRHERSGDWLSPAVPPAAARRPERDVLPNVAFRPRCAILSPPPAPPPTPMARSFARRLRSGGARVREHIKNMWFAAQCRSDCSWLRGRNGCGCRVFSEVCAFIARCGCCCRLAVHALHCNESPGIIDDVSDRRRLRRRPVATDAGDLLSCREQI